MSGRYNDGYRKADPGGVGEFGFCYRPALIVNPKTGALEPIPPTACTWCGAVFTKLGSGVVVCPHCDEPKKKATA